MNEILKLIIVIVAVIVLLSIIFAIYDLIWGGHKDTKVVYGKSARKVVNGN